MTCSHCGEHGHSRRKHRIPPIAGGGALTKRYKRAWGKHVRDGARARKACVECGDPAAKSRCEPCAAHWAARQKELREQRAVYLVTLRQIQELAKGTPSAEVETGLCRIAALADSALTRNVPRETNVTINNETIRKGA